MNVSRVEHQRSILASLGIDVWMPRADVSARPYTATLYRDQAAPEQNKAVNFTLDVAKHTEKSMQSAAVSAQSTSKSMHDAQVKTPLPIVEATPEVVQTVQQPEPIALAAFVLHAWRLDHCVLLLDATTQTSAEQNLWRNIQQAKLGQFFDLNWPFALTPLQDGRGVDAYIRGFMDGLIEDRKLISLGDLPHYQDSRVIQLASLQQMLDQPVLKRRLWQFMQGQG